MSFFKKKNHARIYLDHASTTPTDPRVVKKMLPYMAEKFYNPSALYEEGVEVKKAIAEARKTVGGILNVRSEEIIFTGSGTEANNLALLGVVKKAKTEGAIAGASVLPHIVTTVIEHPAILETCKEMESWGAEVTYVPVKENGIVDPAGIAAALKSNTVLVSVMYANNEIGTIQPIKEISRVIKKYREKHNTAYPYFHIDASQAAEYLQITVPGLGVDLMTIDGSKIYGPKGIGALYVKKGVALSPIMFGGGQEKGLRPGTENAAAIVGFAEAIAIAQNEREKESDRLIALRNYFIENILTKISSAYLNGDKEKRLPNNINVCIPGIDSEFAVIQLDERGIACASVSSCKNLTENSSSYVIEALGDTKGNCANSSLRFSLGRGTTKLEIDQALTVISDLFKELKKSQNLL